MKLYKCSLHDQCVLKSCSNKKYKVCEKCEDFHVKETSERAKAVRPSGRENG